MDPAADPRYARHLVIPEVGRAGQERLAAARVALVGLGGLGSPVALYLAAAGVGTLGLIDDDRVERSNLQRQVLFGERDLGRPKVEAAAERLADLNPQVQAVLHRERLGAGNAREILGAYDVVVDGSDNFATRYLVNDTCVLLGKPDVYGSVLRFSGQVAVFDAHRGPCYRCLHPRPPAAGLVPSCAEAGVLGVLPGIVGALQACEALKLILGRGEPLVGRLLLLDALGAHQRTLRIARDPACPACGAVGRGVALAEEPAACLPRGESGMSAVPSVGHESGRPVPFELDVQELAAWREQGRRFVLLDVRTAHETTIASLPGSFWIPLPELARRLGELDPGGDLVVHCHLGGRSAQAVAFLRQRGFERARNLAGGIDAWSREIDPKVPRY